MTVELVGGIGVFLLGMVLLTEGLKAAAGRSLRRGLARFTANRWAAVGSGALATTVVQSSTATTMTSIGLVAAGLLPPVNAVGVILGANLGTTSTAWIVAYFGLKLDISAVAMVAVALGAVMRLLGKGRVAAAAYPLAGFGLLFVGIDIMQRAMTGLADAITLPGGAGASFGVLLLLVGIGAAMTIVMQSSSAAVATTLTALSAGAIGLEQAAALVIGQNIGTTPKALLAALGASVHARRTAMAHVVFNLGTGAVALGLLPAFIALGTAMAAGGGGDAAITLAVFHTLFNVVGVVLVVPWLPTFTGLVSRTVPDRGAALTRFLSRASANEPAVAVESARTTLLLCVTEIGDETMTLATRAASARDRQAARVRLTRVRGALDEVRTFLAGVRTNADDEGDGAIAADRRRHVSVLHALDHLLGALGLLERGGAVDRFARSSDTAELREHLHEALLALVDWAPVRAPEGPADDVLERFVAVPDIRRASRRRVLRRIADRDGDPDEAEDDLEALAWAEAFSHHLKRATHHLREPAPGDEA